MWEGTGGAEVFRLARKLWESGGEEAGQGIEEAANMSVYSLEDLARRHAKSGGSVVTRIR